MQFLTLVASLLATTSAVSAHYTFNSLILPNGQVTPQFQYIRRHTQGIEPNRGNNRALIASNNFRCNAGSANSGPSTQVAVVAAGQRIGFKSYYDKVEHPGPLQIYMSKAPGNVQNYDGSGDWFKVHQETTCGSTADGLQDTDWCTWGRNEFMFTIPKETPPGDYLVRVEHMAIHQSHIGNPEFYFSCAQVRVTGNGTGRPGPLVKIPGMYNLDAPDFNFNIYWQAKSYPYKPGPALWNGAAGTGSGSTSPPPPAVVTPTPTPTPTPAPAPVRPPPAAICSGMWGQCGGLNWTGPKCCSAGSCQKSNDWYSQCR